MLLPAYLNLENNGQDKNVNYPMSEWVFGRQGLELMGLASSNLYHLPLLKIRGIPPLPYSSTLISGWNQKTKME